MLGYFKLFIGKTKNNGKGLFANVNIKKNEMLFVVKGKIRKEDRYYKGYLYQGKRWLGIGKYKWIMTSKSNLMFYCNHSCNPNAGIKRKNKVIAMKNIKKGKEITFDYSTTEEDPYWYMMCKCGNKNCRKVIKNVCSLPKNTFNRYRNYIPNYFRILYQHNRKNE